MDVSSVSAGTSVSIVVIAPADNSPLTRRVETLPLSNSPTTSLSWRRLNLTFNEDIQFEETCTVYLRPNSVAGSGDECTQAESADGSFAVHLVTSESASWCTLGVGLDQESHPNQSEYLLIETGARTGQISKVDVVLPSGPTGMDPSQTSFFQLLRIGTKMVGPGVSKVVSYLAASVFIVSDTG